MAILVTQLPECFGISRRIKGAGEVQLQLELVACGKAGRGAALSIVQRK